VKKFSTKVGEANPFDALKKYREKAFQRLNVNGAADAKEPRVLTHAPKKKGSDAKKRSVETIALEEGLSEQGNTEQGGNLESHRVVLPLPSVTPDLPLSRELKNILSQAMVAARQEMGAPGFEYIDLLFERKVEVVSRANTPWVRDLAEQMRRLYQMYQAHCSGEFPLDKDMLALIGATLFYFVDPFDHIPDNEPGRGYLDDAYIYNQCVAELNRRLRSVTKTNHAPR